MKTKIQYICLVFGKKEKYNKIAMNKRIILLVLLLLNVFFYSCSTKKNVTDNVTDNVTEENSEEVLIPSNPSYNDNGLNGEAVDIEDLRKEHYERQTKAVQKEMKKNEKISMKNTPVRKKKFSCKYNSKKSPCGNVDEVMINDGVRDSR